jgi:hypothetical protein
MKVWVALMGALWSRVTGAMRRGSHLGTGVQTGAELALRTLPVQ